MANTNTVTIASKTFTRDEKRQYFEQKVSKLGLLLEIAERNNVLKEFRTEIKQMLRFNVARLNYINSDKYQDWQSDLKTELEHIR